MINNWPFHDTQPGFHVLVCPECSNKLIFIAVPLQGRQIWKCGQCGNQLSLKLTSPDREDEERALN